MVNRQRYTEEEFAESILCFGRAINEEMNKQLRKQFEALRKKNEGPEPWELLADQAAIDHEVTDRDIEDLEERIKEAGLTNKENGERLEKMNAAEIDHPWHAYIRWSECYTQDCLLHYNWKFKHDHFPINQIPVYYDRKDMEERIRRRRSTGQLQSKN